MKVLNALTVVEDVTTAELMQRGVPFEVMTFATPFQMIPERFQAIYVRWPCANWFERKNISQDKLQDWVRQSLMHCRAPGGDFQYV